MLLLPQPTTVLKAIIAAIAVPITLPTPISSRTAVTPPTIIVTAARARIRPRTTPKFCNPYTHLSTSHTGIVFVSRL
ncbi:hypothetical protein HOY82DRAFT_563933, partial [Tuber indicum]